MNNDDNLLYQELMFVKWVVVDGDFVEMIVAFDWMEKYSTNHILYTTNNQMYKVKG